MNALPKKNIYFAADAHLGNRYLDDPMAAEKKLVRWMDSIKNDAQAIYFLGDMFDYWYEYKYVVPKGHVRFLGKLAELCDRGIEIHLFIGNHDVWMFDYLPEETGVVIHQGPLITDLLGKRFFLAHGDEVGKQKLSFRFLQAMFRNKVCQFFYSGIHPWWTFGFARRWSLSSRKKGIEKKKQATHDRASANLLSFSTEYSLAYPDIHFFIFGHCHILLDTKPTDTSRMLIIGDWMHLFSYLKWDGNELIVRQFKD
jgi:UDP-2,3-diacylglucosamine hydrolase